ncbi:MAG: type II secretion system protein GspM [Betaproteobacteria bacterium]
MSAWPPLQARWGELSRRERGAVRAAAALLLLAALWWLGMAPALNTLRGAEQQHRLLEAQLQDMQTMQAQARALQAQPRLAPEEARRLLEASVKPLAPGLQLSLVGDRATVTLKGVAADTLAQWLAQVRLNLRLLPTEARLRRSAPGVWDGTLVLNLGAP